MQIEEEQDINNQEERNYDQALESLEIEEYEEELLYNQKKKRSEEDQNSED